MRISVFLPPEDGTGTAVSKTLPATLSRLCIHYYIEVVVPDANAIQQQHGPQLSTNYLSADNFQCIAVKAGGTNSMKECCFLLEECQVHSPDNRILRK